MGATFQSRLDIVIARHFSSEKIQGLCLSRSYLKKPCHSVHIDLVCLVIAEAKSAWKGLEYLFTTVLPERYPFPYRFHCLISWISVMQQITRHRIAQF